MVTRGRDTCVVQSFNSALPLSRPSRGEHVNQQRLGGKHLITCPGVAAEISVCRSVGRGEGAGEQPQGGQTNATPDYQRHPTRRMTFQT